MRPSGGEVRRGCDQELAAGAVRAERKAWLQALGRAHGVELPVMPVGDVRAIHEAEQALIDAKVDPGPWNPP